MRLRIHTLTIPILEESSGIELRKVPSQEPVLISLILVTIWVPTYQLGFSFPSLGEVSIMHEPPAAGPARKQQMVQ